MLTNDKIKKQEKKKDDDWMTKRWRPMMAIMYMAVCIFDFIVAPILYTGVQFWEVDAANDAFRQWQPITLQATGFFHIAMGAVLGVSAFGRSQEKIAGVASGSASFTTSSFSPPNNFNTQLNNQMAVNHNFNSPQSQWNGANLPQQNRMYSNEYYEAPKAIMTNTTGKKIVPEPEYPLI